MRWNNYEVSANVSLLFQELPYIDRFRAARDAGFTAVETWWPFPSAAPNSREVAGLLQHIESAKVRLTGMNVYAGDMAAGERGIAVNADRQGELDSSLSVLREIATETGCHGFNLLYGQTATPTESTAEHAAAIEAYRRAADMLGETGGVILVEPLAQGPNGTYPLTDHRQVLDLLTEIDRENAALLLDTFHLSHNGQDVSQVTEDARGRIGHVQLADSPGRGEPGNGEIAWGDFGAALATSGYQGTVAAEYAPAAGTREGLSWLSGH